MRKTKFFKFKCLLVIFPVLLMMTAFALPDKVAEVAEYVCGDYCNHEAKLKDVKIIDKTDLPPSWFDAMDRAKAEIKAVLSPDAFNMMFPSDAKTSSNITVDSMESIASMFPNSVLKSIIFTDSYGISTEVNLNEKGTSTVLNSCSHVWVHGTQSMHFSSGASCQVVVAEVMSCAMSGCSERIILNVISITWYATCLHTVWR